jgi:histidinol-phosphatase (PHP family)
MHTHSRYDDGAGELAEYAREAHSAGLSAYGASGHSPLPFPCEYAIPLAQFDRYISDVRHAKAELSGQLPVYLGVELDYLPGLDDFYRHELFSRGLDYVVASVHYVDGSFPDAWCYDETEERFVREIAERHEGDPRPIVEDYYRRLTQMAVDAPRWGVPVIVGHLDRITLWNGDDRFFATDVDWYDRLVDGALDAIAAAGCVLEINTSGWNKQAQRANPPAEIFRRARLRGIPAIVSADAHRPVNVAQHYVRGVQELRQAGYELVSCLHDSGWKSVPLPTVPPSNL